MNKIVCKTTPSGKNNLYLTVDGRDIFLFSQDYRKTVSDFYQNPICVDRALDYSVSTGIVVRKTMDKLRVYIPYIEKEYGVSVLKKTKKSQKLNKSSRTRREDDYCVA